MTNHIHEKAAVGFDRAGDAYERGRPSYPPDAVDFLSQALRLHFNSRIVDLGAGTGKFTKLLFKYSVDVIAVEPVEGMRRKFNDLFPNCRIVDGSAERIPLESESVDAVTVAQAFHWFNGPAALNEIHRVLKPGGKLAVIWNARDESLAWVKELTRIIDSHEGGAPRYKTMKWRSAFESTKLFSELQVRHFSHEQLGTIDTVLDRVASISFISALPDDERKNVLDQVRTLVKTHPDTRGSSDIRLPYRTDVFWCEKI